jgi:hypothetical protein
MHLVVKSVGRDFRARERPEAASRRPGAVSGRRQADRFSAPPPRPAATCKDFCRFSFNIASDTAAAVEIDIRPI